MIILLNMLKEQDKKIEKNNEGVVYALSLVFELGYIIALPIVILALGGRLLDRKLDSSPAFLLLGISIAILLSSYLVHQKMKKIV